MINRILIAVDGSKHSLKAVEVGAHIAAPLNAKLVLLHVVKEESMPEAIRQFARSEHLPETDLDTLKRGAQFLLADALDKARAAGAREIDIEVEEGPVARTIAARAENHETDMIVLGSRGMGDLEGMLRGGVSHRVEILAKCPVLIVK